MKLADIKYEVGNYWVCTVDKGYEVYEIGITCSTRKVVIGYFGKVGLEKAIYWANYYDKGVLR